MTSGFFFSSRRRHTRCSRDWSSDVCSSDLNGQYAFRNLPPGQYTIVATHDGREHSAAVTVPDGPALVNDIDLAVLPAVGAIDRSEERRVGKECRSWWSADH